MEFMYRAVFLCGLAVGLNEATPCLPCTGFLAGAVSHGDPCGCGTGIIRKVHTRDDLEEMAQTELNKLARDLENEERELIAQFEGAAAEQEDKLKASGDQAQDLIDQLEGNNNATYDSQQGMLAELKQGMLDIAAQEKTHEEQVTKINQQRILWKQLNADMQMELARLSGCDCSTEILVKTGSVQKRSGLLSVKGPDYPTIFKIEKLEAAIVKLLTQIQDDQTEFNAKMNAIRDSIESAKMKEAARQTKLTNDDVSIKARREAQLKQKETLDGMVLSKNNTLTSMTAKLDDLQGHMASIAQHLQECGC